MRLFWTDSGWQYLAEAVASSASLTLRLNDAGPGMVTVTVRPPVEARGLVAVLADGTEVWRGKIRGYRGSQARNNQQKDLTVYLMDLVGILGDCLAWPEPSGNFAAQEFDSFTGKASSAILHYVDVNAGPSALSWRRLGITLGSDPSLGNDVKVSARFDRLRNLLKEIATLGEVRFRFQGTTLVVDQGVRYDSLLFDVNAGTVEKIEWEYQVPEASSVVAAGEGSGTTRVIVVKYMPSDLAAWGNIEAFWDVRGVSVASDLEEMALQWLRARASGYSAVVTPSIAIRSGILPGDTVRVYVDGQERNMVVTAVTYSLQGWTLTVAERPGVSTPDLVRLGIEKLVRGVELLSTK